MKTKINFNQFCDGFRDRTNFSYEGKQVLFDYLENLEQQLGQLGEEIEYDPIGFCCEFAESDLEELIEQYDALRELCPAFDDEEPSIKDWAKMHETAREFLENRTTLCGITKDGKYIYSKF
jgi:hypothetical protein